MMKLNVRASDTFGDIRKKIEVKEGIPVNQQRLIIWQENRGRGQGWHSYDTVRQPAALDQQLGDFLHTGLSLRVELRTPIFVNKPRRRGVIYVQGRDTNANVKAQIQAIEGVPLNQQFVTINLMHRGTPPPSECRCHLCQ